MTSPREICAENTVGLKVICEGVSTSSLDYIPNTDTLPQHPKIYLAFGTKNSVVCPYCSRTFFKPSPPNPLYKCGILSTVSK